MQENHFPNDIYNKIPCGLAAFKCNDSLELVYANDRYYSDFSNGNTETLNISDEDKTLLLGLPKKLDNAEGYTITYRCIGKNKKKCRISMTVTNFGDGIFLGALWDITEQYNQIQHLQSEQEKYGIVLKFSRNIVFENNVRDDTLTLYIPSNKTNNIDQFVITKGKDIIIKRALWREDRKFFMANMYNEHEEILSARMKVNRAKTWRWYRAHRKFEYDSEGNLIRVFGVLYDIHDQKLHEKELQQRIEMDPELKVYNRNAGVDKTNACIRLNYNRRDYALFVMDIDDFKNINDTFGHLYGDAVISMTASALKKCVDEDDIVGRYGGDEFFIFVQKKTEEEIRSIADNILKTISNFPITNEQNVSCSIGIALGTSFDELPDYRAMFEKADKALYYVKSNGKSNWEIYDEAKTYDSTGHAIDYEKDSANDSTLLETKDIMQAFLEASAGSKTSDEAIYRIMRYIINKFSFNWLQIMQVNCKEDLITIKYELSTDSTFRNNAGRSGYYIHSDIMNFRKYFERDPIFHVTPESAKDFSTKFQREFEKNMNHSVLYNASTTADDSFYMFVCTRFTKENVWNDEEAKALNEATKILTMYVSQADRETERERMLQNQISYDTKTGLYTMEKFYIQIGRLRTLALGKNERVAISHTDIADFLNFNIKFGINEGDNVLKAFAQHIQGNEFPDRNITAHLDGTDIFISAFKISPDDRQFIKDIEATNREFCNIQNKKYPGANLILKTGVYFLDPNDEGGNGINYAISAKKSVKNYTESFCALYEE